MLIAAAVLMLAAADPSDGWDACVDSETPYEDCERQDRERVLAEVGAQPLGEMEGEVLVRRAIFFTDYRRDQPVVEFRHDPGSSPRVIVSFDRLERGVTRLETSVPREVWDQVLSEGRYFDRTLGEAPPIFDDDGEELVSVCFHARHAWVQAYDSDHRAREAGGDTCDDSLAVDYAYRLAELAADLLPACAVLETANYGPSINRLSSCFALEGDTLTAAELMNDLESTPFFYPDLQNREEILWMFVPGRDLRFEWAGQSLDGRDAATDWWIEQVGAAGAGVYEISHTGETWDQVRSRGVFLRPGDPDACPYGPASQAPIEIEWRRSGDSWEIRSLVVGAFSPLPDQEEC